MGVKDAMIQSETELQILNSTLIKEILNAVGLPNTRYMQQIFGRLFQKATNRLAAIGITFDRLILSDGFPKACEWALMNWCRNITARGAEAVPLEGPLLIVSNHAGAYDSVVIASLLGRDDLKFIASDVAFLKNLPNTDQHFLYISGDNNQARSAATRAALRHLKSGGALLLFGTGLIDPDPAVYPNTEKELENWSPSIDLFLRQVPEANVLVTIVSGIVSPRWAHHPITWLKRIPWQKRRLAEFGQVIQQLFFPGQLYVSPRVSFAPPISVDELRHESQGDRVLPAVITRGKTLLAEHLVWIQAQTREGANGR
jgi:hypothetical protein